MIHHGDLFDVLPTLAEASIDACVTDPPYDLTSGKRGGTGEASLNLASPAGRSRISTGGGFMGKTWDATGVAFDPATWREVSRVMKPGAYLVAFGGTRTSHRMVSAIEDAGFEVRDSLVWMYGSGFPKSLNLGDGRGTALKPAHEPICLAWKPFKGTITANVAKHGTGALNIDACRIGLDGEEPPTGTGDRRGSHVYAQDEWTKTHEHHGNTTPANGRWPANVILDDVAAATLDEQTGESVSRIGAPRSAEHPGDGWGMTATGAEYDDRGGASRFFYVAKPSREERDYGCANLVGRVSTETVERNPESAGAQSPRSGAGRGAGVPIYRCAVCGLNLGGGRAVSLCANIGPHEPVVIGQGAAVRNFHPTVKPVELMRWLVRLVTPPGGIVLDPFTGSGTTGMACRYEQRQFIGIEREADYVQIAERRIAAVAPLFADVPA